LSGEGEGVKEGATMSECVARKQFNQLSVVPAKAGTHNHRE